MFEDDDAVADRLGMPKIVGTKHDTASLTAPGLQLFEHFAGRDGIEP